MFQPRITEDREPGVKEAEDGGGCGAGGVTGGNPTPSETDGPRASFHSGRRRAGERDFARVMCAEHVRQLEGESPFDNLMEVKS